MNANNEVVDCRSEAGITVGLIDALISVARVLAPRDFKNPEVQEALNDLAQDEDIQAILAAGLHARSQAWIKRVLKEKETK